MAVQDILNNSLFGSQYLLGDDSYSEQQTDALGNSLSPTPTQAGIPAVDPQNDLRTPIDHKQDRIKANFDTLPAQNTEGKIIGNDGYVFDVAPKGRDSQLRTGLIAFGMSFLAGENEGQSLMRAGQATFAQSQMIKRGELIPSLVKKGYASVDIQKYYETGNPGDLIVNKGKYTPLGDGIHIINQNTGDVKEVGTPQQKLSYHDFGDRVAALDSSGNEVRSYSKGETPEQQSKDDINLFDNNQAGYSFNAKGDLMVTSVKSGKTSTRTATPEELKAYNAQHKTGKAPEESQMFKQYTDDVAYLSAQPKSVLEPVIGVLNMAPDKVQDVLTRFSPEERQVYNRLQSVKSANAAIGAKRFLDMYKTPVKSDADMIAAQRLEPHLDLSNTLAFSQTFKPAVDAQIEAQGWDSDKFHSTVSDRQKTYIKPNQGGNSSTGQPTIHGRFNQATGKIELVQ